MGNRPKPTLGSKDPRVQIRVLAAAVQRLIVERREAENGIQELYSRLRMVAKYPWPIGILMLRRIERQVVEQIEQAEREVAEQLDQAEAVGQQPAPDILVPDKRIVGPDGEAV